MPMARRGRVGSYQLSVFGFQIVAVFGRIRIVHLAHYSVRFEFESNIWYSPSNNRILYARKSNFSAFSPTNTTIVTHNLLILIFNFNLFLILLAFLSTYSQIGLVLCDMSIYNSRSTNVLQHIRQSSKCLSQRQLDSE